ncbi:hypothetical protein F444_20306 [Phytophthora nicotianae P1976]|uniref:Uncharacterized protein n=1 Tax=Phytophthora nicotianae P1976 TaxID=1317066 RepID=A0A080Z4Z6_PHYNI|nr:hypothetical protein F444_20306 [Phytophthora nicotianae P1976]
MDAILSRVGDAELRQHCVDAVLGELKQVDNQVQNVVSALERTLKVVQASRDVHKSLVLNASEQVQASFRQLGESCNQIGPLLRLLYRNMSVVSSSTTEQPATPTSSAVEGAAPTVSDLQTESIPTATRSTDSASTTTSEYEPSSDEDDDDDVEVVDVTPPTRNKKRKAVTVDLSESMPLVRRKTLQENTQTVRNQLAIELRNIRAIQISRYTVAEHKELSSFVKSIFTAVDNFHDWQPRDDPMLAQLLDEMNKRMDSFKDSSTQNARRKAMDEWLQTMTASSFVPSLDLKSIPLKKDPRAASVEKCHGSQDLSALVKSGTKICSKLRTDTSSNEEKKQKYFQPLVDASTKYFASVLAMEKQEIQANGASRYNDSLCMLCKLAGGTSISRKECAQLEELLYHVRLVMPKNKSFRKKAVKLVFDLLALFPPSARPTFNYPASEPKSKKRKKNKKGSS